MAAVLFGSIGALADTSELQREAFNEAFRAHGLDWTWSQQEYQGLLSESGGEQRIAAYARIHGRPGRRRRRAPDEVRDLPAEPPDAARSQPRPGVVDTIEQADRNGVQVALVTTTSSENVAALTQALRPADRRRPASPWWWIPSSVEAPEAGPGRVPATHWKAAQRGRRRLCRRRGQRRRRARRQSQPALPCVAFPGENNAGHEFPESAHRVNELNFGDLAAPSSPTGSCTSAPVQP